jgi:hypothetical protein
VHVLVGRVESNLHRRILASFGAVALHVPSTQRSLPRSAAPNGVFG